MPKHSRLLIAFVCLLPMAALAQKVPLGRIVDLMATPRSAAAKRPEVRVRGLVSIVGEGLGGVDKKTDQVLSSFCMEDGLAGIWVSVSQALRDKIWTGDKEVLFELQEGTEIEIEGLLDEGAFAPVIVPKSLRVLGVKTLPPARVVPLVQLMNGGADVQRVQVTGVVQSIADEAGKRWLLKVETGLFQEHMLVEIHNNGPVTILLESKI